MSSSKGSSVKWPSSLIMVPSCPLETHKVIFLIYSNKFLCNPRSNSISGKQKKKMTPKDIHVLISKTCKYVTLPDKKDFADGGKLKILK